jgi:hypothetical protein
VVRRVIASKVPGSDLHLETDSELKERVMAAMARLTV